MRILGYILFLSIAYCNVYAQSMSQSQLYAAPTENAADINSNSGFNNFWNNVDDIVYNTNSENFSSHEHLAIYLTEQFKDESSKVRSIYSWIANNISYDRKSITDPSSRESQHVDDVWENRKAVCEGFANLFNMMCASAGIESRMVKGYVKNLTGNDLKFPNHAWNGVKIDGKWQLLDVTWASVNNEGKNLANTALNKATASQQLDYFFLVNPNKMILTHLPEDPYWQLQNSYISMEVFIKDEAYIASNLMNPYAEVKDFEQLIEEYEMLDSLDKSIAYLERMESNKWNKAKEYGLGIAYYYKAQSILNDASQNKTNGAVENAKYYFKKSLDQLQILQEDDYGYEFSKDLANSVVIRIESLQ